MKRTLFSLVVVVALIVMALPADFAVARQHGGDGGAATNQTSTTQTADDELDSVISLAGLVAPPSAWPTAWTPLATDEDGNCDAHRNVYDTDEDGYALYYYLDSDYIYLRMETMDSPGWPSTKPAGDARYKWWFNTDETPAYVSGTSVYKAEFLLMLEDFADNSNDPDASRDQLGELTLMDDLNNDTFKARWNSANPPSYTINDAQTDPTGNSTWWRRVLGLVTGTPGVGGPQGVMGWDIGYRIDNTATGGNFLDMYVSRAALGNPSSLCIIWATDNQNPNLDQAPNCDRPEETYCIMLGNDYGDAPDPKYPTLYASDGARHDAGDLYLGADVDVELDGIQSPDAMGDDDDYIDDEDGVDFTTSLVQGELANVIVTASAAGYLDAWLDFNEDGDWADGGEQIFTSRSLSSGPNSMNFLVPFSATATNETFARFRFSSAGGLSYDGPADDGEVEDYMVEIEGCTLNVDLTGDTHFCEGSNTTITAVVTGGTTPYTYDWSGTADGVANDGSFTATGSGTVAVTVTDYNGCTGSDSVKVTADKGPTADFFSDVTSCCKPLTVQFSDNSTAGDNTIVSWEWDFGDGNTSTDEDPSHTYDSDGIYNVSLTVTDSHGCSDSVTKENYITSNKGPTADFSSNVTSCCEPLSVKFTDTSTEGDNPIVSWEWSFGDGDTSIEQNPSHTYDTAGTYTVTLTVTDAHGCVDDEIKENYITTNDGPTADFSSNVTDCCNPLSVKFTDASTAGNNPIISWEWNFGDGDTSTEQDPSHTYDTAGNYTVSLTVTDSHGCKDTETKENYITSNEGPTAAFFSDVTDCCKPLTVEFCDHSTAGSNPIVSWYWEFGDGGTSTQPGDPSHTYNTPGTYDVTLTVTDSHGCSDSVTKENYITVNEVPTADFSSNVTDCCEPLSVNFTDLSTAGSNPIVSWYWDFGDGDTSTDRNPSHIYAAGTYDVTLTVTDLHGCSDNITKAEYIKSNEGPTADFYSDKTDCCDPLTVQFSDNSTDGSNPIVSWYWDFGDGYNSTAEDPTHIYAAGTYNVTLTVTDSHGCSDTVTKEEYITSNEGPTADFSSNVTDCCAPLTVQFSDNSTAGSNPIVSWEWEFGDGTTSTTQNATHTYNTPGFYTVILTVTDSHGCQDTKAKENYITANEGPTADFFSDVRSCCNPLTVKFTDTSSAGNNPIVSWSWDFGDGDTSTTEDPIHTYDTPGTYNVTLTVTDSHGCKDTETKEAYITSNEVPTADFSSNVTDCCKPLTVQFSDNSTAGSNRIKFWSWDFGDGGTSNAENPSHTYDTSGTYNVTLTVTDEHLCSDTETKTEYITVNEVPTADFSSNVTDCCEPLAVQFSDNSTAGSNPIVSWEWDFGDGDTSTEKNPSHTYNASGTYTVTLTVTDEHGCKDDEIKEEYITANEGPTADFSSDVRSCCNPLTVHFFDESMEGDNPIVSWSWDFGDGSGSTAGPTPMAHTYTNPGTYNVTLTVIDEHGCQDTETKEAYITSNKVPTADFSSNVTSCCTPLTVQFSDNSTAGSNPIILWLWDFGDGDTSTDRNPTHTYDMPGTYTVSLMVLDEHGCIDSETKIEYITSNEGPTADFSSDVRSCCNPLTVKFTDGSTVGSNPIVSWSWDFGDGDTSTAEDPIHTYDMPGTYNVTLTVIDSHGCKDTETKEAYITSNEGPTAAFSADPTSGYRPLVVQFTDLSTAGDNPIVSWYWEFGDGDTSTGKDPSHTYNDVGTYTVTLTVTDKHGCTDDATTIIVVTVPTTPPAGGCPSLKELTVDWEGNNTTEPLYSNDKLAVDLLGPSSDLIHNLFLEQGTHAPVVFKTTHYLIIVRELEEIPALPEDTTAIVVFNITPTGAGFDKDIFLTLGIDELPQNALNVSMAYYDDITGVWVLMDSEAGGPNGVAELTLSAPINHFSIFGVLAATEPTSPPQPAHFVASGLNIVPSVEKLSVFVTKTGGSATITANVDNDGGQAGTYTAQLKLNGQIVDTKTVTLSAGQSKPVSFTVSELDYGQYEVEVAGLSDEFTTSRTITWWLILVIIAAIGLIIWGVVWGRRRRKAQQEA